MAVKDFTKHKPRIFFADIVLKMKLHLERLENSTPFLANVQSLPTKAGVYVFYERNKPLYVGRTGNLRKRMAQHRNSGSRHNDAPFAFHLAKREAKKGGLSVNDTRANLCNNPIFKIHFATAKARVSNMKVRFVEIEEAREQSLFEYYASIELHTPWNDHSNS